MTVDSRGNVFAGQKALVSVFNAKGELARSIPATDLSALFLSARGLPVVVRKGALQPENAQPVLLWIPQPGAQARAVEEIPAAVETSKGEWLISDRKTKSVLLFASGKYVRTHISGVDAERLALNGLGDLAILDRDNKSVVLADRDGKVVRKFGPRGDGCAKTRRPRLRSADLWPCSTEEGIGVRLRSRQEIRCQFSLRTSPGTFQRAAAQPRCCARLYVRRPRTTCRSVSEDVGYGACVTGSLARSHQPFRCWLATSHGRC